MDDFDHYRDALAQIADHLAAHGEAHWSQTLRQWLRELDGPGLRGLAHVRRTRRCLGGMGSLGDVVICPEAGHKIANDPATVKAANDRLLSMVHELGRICGRLEQP